MTNLFTTSINLVGEFIWFILLGPEPALQRADIRRISGPRRSPPEKGFDWGSLIGKNSICLYVYLYAFACLSLYVYVNRDEIIGFPFSLSKL